MKNVFCRTIMFILVLTMIPAMFTACSSDPAATPTPQAAVDPAAPTVVTIHVDGRTITFEDATGMSVQQLLDQAGIILNDGDMLAFAPEQSFPGDISFRVHRQHTVTVTVAAENPVRHTAVLMDGTVADAIAAVGVELAESHTVNFELNKDLEDGMQIMISGEHLPEVPVVTEPTDSTEPTPDSTAPAAPNPGQSDKTIVSIEVYEDCDGSGHGIKVITYSDGTQEEVMF